MSLTKAFKDLRKAGYFARQSFQCCQGCGWASVPEGKSDKVVFYHQQDKSDLYRHGYVHLAWSGDGEEIKNILTENDLTVEWNGSDTTRIKVYA